MSSLPPEKSRSKVKIWVAAISAVTAVAAILPPLVSAIRANPALTQNGEGNSAIVGSTVGSHNQTSNTYISMWVEGAKTMLGVAPRQGASPESLIQSFPTATGGQPAQTAAATPEPGAIGRLVDNASLLNDATWTPDASRVGRLLTFRFHVQAAAGADDKPGSMDATLARDGRDICTISLNTRTSALSRGVRWANSVCKDTLPPNAPATYRARVKSLDMVPVVVVLDHVDAVRK